MNVELEEGEILELESPMPFVPAEDNVADEEAAKKAEEEAKAAADKKAEEEAAAKKKADEEAAAQAKVDEAAAANKKAEEEAAAKAAADKAKEEAAAKAEEQAAAAKKKADEEAAANKKAEEEKAAADKANEDAAATVNIPSATTKKIRASQLSANDFPNLANRLFSPKSDNLHKPEIWTNMKLIGKFYPPPPTGYTTQDAEYAQCQACKVIVGYTPGTSQSISRHFTACVARTPIEVPTRRSSKRNLPMHSEKPKSGKSASKKKKEVSYSSRTSGAGPTVAAVADNTTAPTQDISNIVIQAKDVSEQKVAVASSNTIDCQCASRKKCREDDRTIRAGGTTTTCDECGQWMHSQCNFSSMKKVILCFLCADEFLKGSSPEKKKQQNQQPPPPPPQYPHYPPHMMYPWGFQPPQGM